MGLIEITDPLEGESRVLSPAHVEDFLSSILNKEIHFYFAQNHNQTDRYLEGKNPEIIAVIRFLTKAHHFGLNIKEEDWQLIKQLSLDFEATQTYDKYVYNWLKFNVHKMLFLAKDKGALMAHLESLGLRAKLSHLHEHFDSEVNQFLRPKSCSIFLGAGLYF